jgi:hypothetical protein
MTEHFIKGLRHNGQFWSIMRINDSYFARCNGSDVGPYSTVQQAEEWIREIKP